MEIFTRSQNPELFALSTSLTKGFKRTPMVGRSAEGYVAELLSTERGWICNMDEDVFLCSEERLRSFRDYLQDNGYHYCGMRDGGVLPIRQYNPSACNPFFNIFNTDTIARELPAFKSADFADPRIAATLEPNDFPSRYSYCNYEPYYPLFLWLRAHFPCYFMEASTHTDGLSTILYDHRRRPLLIHTWYARDFAHSKSRFHTALQFAVSNSGEAPGEKEPPDPLRDAAPLFQTVEIVHPHWTDKLRLFPSGVFQRTNGDSGMWDQDTPRILRLHWFDWKPEIFCREEKTGRYRLQGRG